MILKPPARLSFLCSFQKTPLFLSSFAWLCLFAHLSVAPLQFSTVLQKWSLLHIASWYYVSSKLALCPCILRKEQEAVILWFLWLASTNPKKQAIAYNKKYMICNWTIYRSITDKIFFKMFELKLDFLVGPSSLCWFSQNLENRTSPDSPRILNPYFL